MSKELSKLFIGSFYHSLRLDGGLEYFKLALMGVDNQGIISFLQPIDRDFKDEEEKKDAIDGEIENIKASGWKVGEVLILKSKQFMIPGLIDTHIHAPQYVFTGTGYDLTLLKWLETYTFPREAAFSNSEYAKHAYAKVVRKTLSCGTTTACYYATTHSNSSIILAETCARLGQRAFVGKVNMDRNSPAYYSEKTDESIEETIRFVKHVVDKIASPLVTPCITPRFVPSCSPELMKELGSLAKTHNLPIQSHLSETYGEIEWVKELHPDSSSYSAVYDEFGLLSDKTVMAHCIHLKKEERDLLRTKKVGISHCPSSNFCLHSGVLNIARLIEEGHEKIGLGTDCAGGYSPSIMDSMRQALMASKVVHIDSHLPSSEKNYNALNFAQVFHLATLGGAKVMGLDDKIGNFVVGKEFDALLIDLDIRDGQKPLLLDQNRETACSNFDVFDHDDYLTIFEKFIYLGDDRAISQVYVGGDRIL